MKKVIFSLICLTLASSAAVASNQLPIPITRPATEVSKKALPPTTAQDCLNQRALTYSYLRAQGFSDDQASATASQTYFNCMGSITFGVIKRP
ncbi:hypothetical protein [Flavobacterium sp.]|uniref:hypothetical protein n=1 Tax=Flavobacterium sp. TaxID=239 RepID=UPI002618BF5A|nr:hypothetical protein [Flavobacterium sp.]